MSVERVPLTFLDSRGLPLSTITVSIPFSANVITEVRPVGAAPIIATSKSYSELL